MNIDGIEQIIMNLKGVLRAKIVQESEDEISEVHVIADESRSPKQISRDVQAIFQTINNISLDYKKISIAQIRGDVMGKWPLPEPTITGFVRKAIGSKCYIRVILEKDGNHYIGESSGVNSFPLVLRKTGEATLLALEAILGKNGVLDLEDTKIVNLNNTQAIIVSVTAFIHDKTVEHCGCATLSEDKHESMIKAVLAASIPLLNEFSSRNISLD